MAIIYKEANPGNFKRGRSCGINYIVIHYTANNGDTAQGNANYFFGTVTQTSAHYFVDEGADIWQTVKDCDTAWHCGTKGNYVHPFCRNDNSIGIELCSRKDAAGKYYFKAETVDNAAALTRELMTKHEIPAANIVRHYDVTGKLCPMPFVESTEQWEDFLNRLADPKTPDSVPEEIIPSTINFDLLGQKRLGIGGFNIEGKVYAGARELLEALDYLVGWDDATKTVLVRNKQSINTTAEDQFVLEKIVEAEAGCEDELGKILVANVIINRLNSSCFPDSISQVVFQPQQFEPIRNGAFDKAIPTVQTVNAVQYALNGDDYSQGALFFRSIAGATPECWHECALTRLFDHGGHRFYSLKS